MIEIGLIVCSSTSAKHSESLITSVLQQEELLALRITTSFSVNIFCIRSTEWVGRVGSGNQNGGNKNVEGDLLTIG